MCVCVCVCVLFTVRINILFSHSLYTYFLTLSFFFRPFFLIESPSLNYHFKSQVPISVAFLLSFRATNITIISYKLKKRDEHLI